MGKPTTHLTERVSTTGHMHFKSIDTDSGTTYQESDTEYERITFQRWKSSITKSDGVHPTAYAHVSQTMPMVQTDWNESIDEFDIEYQADNTPYVDSDALLHNVGGNNENARINTYSNNENRVRTQCLANLGEGKVDLGIAFAESYKTAKTIADLGVDFLQALVAIKKGDVRALKRLFGSPHGDNHSGNIAGSVAERFLQYQYGVRPLVNDICGAVEIHNDGLSKGDPTALTIEATSSFRTTEHLVTDTLDSTAKLSYICKMRARIVDRDQQALQLLGLSNPYQAGYELLPWSFIADWAVPIGTFIRASNALIGLEYQFGYLSIKGSCEGTFEGPGFVQCGLRGCTGHYPLQYSSNGFSRELVSPVVLPYVKNPLSLEHGANFSALMQVLRR